MIWGKKLFILFFSSLWLSSSASLGDIDIRYRRCCQNCFDTRHILNVTLFRHLLFWDDWSECQYQCMRSISDERVKNDLIVYKYHGHWPYYRIYGVQEPAAALFSLGNVLPHALYLSSLSTSHQKGLFKRRSFMTSWILLNACLASIAWLCSTVFHTRKIDVTINLDYMSALIFLFHGFWLALRRTLHGLLFHTNSPILTSLTFSLLSLICLYRLYQMAHGRISFDSHMELCIFLAVSQCLLWCLWCIFAKRSSPSLRRYCLFLQLWFALAALLEIFDFPPVAGHFDAHALWHAATIPLGFMWYWFWERDSQEQAAFKTSEGRDKQEGGERERSKIL
jgi:post-GPI attachment to proteins factor 3